MVVSPGLARAQGVELWRGPSRWDRGAELVVLATGLRRPSANGGTGPVVQTYILRADRDPWQAVGDRSDAAICGNCVHRGRPEPGRATRSCYVMVWRDPLSVWRAWRRGAYAEASSRELGALLRARGLPLRVGTYGDPGAVPWRVWGPLVAGAPRHTAYSHAWRRLRAPSWRRHVMASVEGEGERAEAERRGWRTFRVDPRELLDVELLPDELLCPKMVGLATCASCALCGGAEKRAKSIVAPVHGSLGGRFEG